VRTGEPLVSEAALEEALPTEEVTLVVERFDTLRSVHRDDAQLVHADSRLPRLVPSVVIAAPEPPEHRQTYLLTATTVSVPRRMLDPAPATVAVALPTTNWTATLKVCEAPGVSPATATENDQLATLGTITLLTA
jgi:hypothetical protein